MVLRVAAFPERRAAGAGERQRGGVHEHNGELAEQVAPALEQLLLDLVFDGARGETRGTGLLGGVELFAQPRHGAVEMVQREPVAAGNVVVGHPLLAGAVGSRDHDPV